jgi:hypothetical protein
LVAHQRVGELDVPLHAFLETCEKVTRIASSHVSALEERRIKRKSDIGAGRCIYLFIDYFISGA